MRATAQLDRVADLQDPDDVAVLVSEERNRAERGGFVLRRLKGPRRCIGQRLAVGDLFDLGDLCVGDRVVVAEVEPKPVGSDQGASLLDVLAKHLAQRVVQHVRAGVVAADRGRGGDVDRRRHGWPRSTAAGDRAV
jgi:hypothetical protein